LIAHEFMVLLSIATVSQIFKYDGATPMYDMIYSFGKGLAFGFTMAAIPGPIFFLIIQRTLNEGLLTGLCCALGAITADTVYALIAAVGLTFIMQFLLAHQALITFVGGLFLLYLAYTTYKRTVRYQSSLEAPGKQKLFTAWASTFLLTMSNPVTIVSYCLIFASLGFDALNQNKAALFALVGGVLVGATSVFVILISFLKYFRQHISVSKLQFINKGAAILLFCFGIATLVKSLNTSVCS
jgi:threonine/homoserine/homoserine lactone efflux protein